MNIVKEDDGVDFVQVRPVQPPEGGAQPVGVRVFAVDHYDHLFTVINVVVDIALDIGSGIRHLAVFGKLVIVPLIKEGNKLFVVIQDISRVIGTPVDIHLIRIEGKALVIHRCRILASFLAEAVRHDKQFPHILPVQPKRKQAFAIIDPV